MGRGDMFGIPWPSVVTLFLLAVAVFITIRLSFGRFMYAIGNNPDAAKMLGIPVDRVRVMVFTDVVF
jgi:ribose transport system permease protein